MNNFWTFTIGGIGVGIIAIITIYLKITEGAKKARAQFRVTISNIIGSIPTEEEISDLRIRKTFIKFHETSIPTIRKSVFDLRPFLLPVKKARLNRALKDYEAADQYLTERTSEHESLESEHLKYKGLPFKANTSRDILIERLEALAHFGN